VGCSEGLPIKARRGEKASLRAKKYQLGLNSRRPKFVAKFVNHHRRAVA